MTGSAPEEVAAVSTALDANATADDRANATADHGANATAVDAETVLGVSAGGLTIVGSADAAVCEDGFCWTPGDSSD